jgi:hypothetical protein
MTLSITNPTWIMLGLNLVLQGQKMEANFLTYDTGTLYPIPWNNH